jgi:crotonobetainyl-CoA:carnitine CoA-transferase CaiB-like acyl-CoA transferase
MVRAIYNTANPGGNEIMQILEPDMPGGSANRPAAALEFDASSIVVKISSTTEARALPCGSIVGDLHGGLTFTDAVAAVLESRSNGGWKEVIAGSATWTVIRLDR